MERGSRAVPAAARDCFHCGLPVPAGALFGHDAPEGWRAFCCPGCEAVSGAISGLGLDDYYRLRSAPAPKPEGGSDGDFTAFDDPVVQSRFVSPSPSGEGGEGGRVLLEAQLLLEGLRCSACAWLVEQAVSRQPGVRSLELNYATRRARLRWDPAATKLSAVLATIRALGYSAWPHEEGRLALIEGRERRALLRRLWVAALGMMQVMMYAVPTYLAADGEIAADAGSLMRWAGLVLTLPVIAYSSAPFFAGAWRDLGHARLGMDVPVAVGLAAAFAASVAATLGGVGEVYFDSITMFVFLLTGGRYLELLARQKAGSALEHLGRLVPQTAQRLGDARSGAATIPVARLVAGDRVLVRPGEAVPADGELETQAAQLSEAWLSGESRPVSRCRGDTIYGGSVNAGPAVVMRVTRVGADTAVSAIHRLMERALGERPRWVELAQRASGLFVAFILAAAAAAGATWLAIDPSRALWVAVSVLIVTCPCALALATPVVVTAATGALARVNFVAARAHAIERLASATHFVFDKTGTLTHGELRLLETLAFARKPWGRNDDCPDPLGLAASLASCSAHPVDRALLRAAQKPGTDPDFPHSGKSGSVPGFSYAGEGIEARVEGRRVRLGNARFVGELAGSPVPVAWIRSEDTVAYLGDEAGWIGAFRLGDATRAEAAQALRRLRAMGVGIQLLSGDADGVVRRAAAELGIEEFVAGATPEAKLRHVRDLQRAGATVAMVGDGVNDAPVLAQADVSIAMGGGARLAQAGADAVLLSDSLADLADAVALARRARRVMRQNLAWALAYNLVAIPLAFAGLVTPLLAGIGMSASSLLVVANAARVRR